MAVFQVARAQDGSDAEIWAVDLETKERRFLTQGTLPTYASSGHLLWGTPEGTLMAAPIDSRTAELTALPVPVAEGLLVDGFGSLDYSVAENGTLIYREGVSTGDSQMTWMSRSGVLSPFDPVLQFHLRTGNVEFALSPDGSKLAFTARNEDTNDFDIWIRELPDGASRRLTFDDQGESNPTWAADGQYLTYIKGGDVWRVSVDGSGAPELVLDDERVLFSASWSPDGAWLIARTRFDSTQGQRDIVGFRPGLDQAVIPLVATEAFDEVVPSLSPDGRWLLYSSNETGQYEVYVRPFPIVDSPAVPVSRDGGGSPRWAHSGRELFYVSNKGNLISVAVRTDNQFTVLQRETLFSLPLLTRGSAASSSFDVSSDDQQFLFVSPSIASDSRFVLVQNFFEELKRRVPN